MNVVILGSGMTGLLAAKACLDEGITPHIISREDTGPGHGVRYLHDSCGLPIRPLEIETAFMTQGQVFNRFDDVNLSTVAEIYANKTGASKTNNSIHRSQKIVKAYSWNDAWNLLQGLRIEHREIDHRGLKSLKRAYDLVISTLPLPVVHPHLARSCRSRTFYVTDSSPYPNNMSAGKPENIVVYNADMDTNWTRYSRVDGVEQTEWMAPVEGSHPVTKVDGNASYVEPRKNLLLVGRYGTWDHSYMAHHAYYDTIRRIHLLRNLS